MYVWVKNMFVFSRTLVKIASFFVLFDGKFASLL